MRVLKSTLLALALLAIGASQASAAHIYAHVGSFDGSETEAGRFGYLSPAALAVDETTGDVYAVDIEFDLVLRFDADGVYKSQISGAGTPNGSFDFNEPTSIAVDNSGGVNNGYLYVADLGNDVIQIFNPSGAYVGQLKGTAAPGGSISGAGGVTVDGSGDVYVSDYDNKRILKFTPTGGPVEDSDYVSEITHESLTNPGSLGADAAGNLYVTNFHSSFVKFDASGAYVGVVGGTGLNREVEVNQATGEVFFDLYSFVQVTDPSNVELARIEVTTGGSYGVAVNGKTSRVYIANGELGFADIYDAIDVPKATTGEAADVLRTTATLNGTVNTDGAGAATCEFEYGLDTSYGQTAPCVPAGPFVDNADHAVSAEISGLTPESTYHFRIKASNADGDNFGIDRTFVPHAVTALTTEPATEVQAHSATLNASFEAEGEDTQYHFEYGTTTSYGKTVPVPDKFVAGTTPGVHQASAPVGGLTEATTYHYRVVAENSFGVSYGEDEELTTIPDPPQISQFVTDVHSDSAVLHARIRPGGGATAYHFEWGTENCSLSACTSIPVPDGSLLDEVTTEEVSIFLGELQPGTTYHYRTVATNVSGTTEAPDRTFTTFPFTELIDDPCPNAHVRQQTSAALLLDCRAYELVSAADTGGYDVASDLVPGQSPFGGFPDATHPPRVLYAVQEGLIPGTGRPTNHGPDPYVATRGPEGWTTAYVGIPADGAPSSAPFGSPVAAADASLTTFAFGGVGICDPCYDDGSINMPLRLSGGGLVKGMAGSLDPGPADPAGTVRKRLSADGTHFVFGATAKFEPTGNGGGDVTIYDRDLGDGTTQVVSKLPDGSTMTGTGIAQLDISADGSRIVVAEAVSTDAAGNTYWHPYMHIDGSEETIDLAPGTSTGVLYNGMTPDGTEVLLASPDKLTLDDGDSSADLFRVSVGSSSAAPSRVSTGTGGSGNTDACDPVANSENADWNSVDEASDCSVAAIAGGGGIADDGSVYFLSPERLTGAEGVQGAPNLFLGRRGSAPQYVTTLESSLNGPPFEYGRLLESELKPIAGPASVAVNRTTGHVYVLDKATSTIRRYDASGAPAPFSASAAHISGNTLTGTPAYGDFDFETIVGQLQIAVDSSSGPTAGYLYVTDAAAAEGIDVFDATGAYMGEVPPPPFGGDCGVTVDDSGNVYVGTTFSGIKKFTPVDGNPANNVASGAASGLGTCNVAVDSAGDVYTNVWFLGQAAKYDASSFSGPTVQTTIATGGVKAVAVDPTSDDVLVDFGSHVTEYDPAGAEVAQFGSGELQGSAGIAVAADGTAYVANPGRQRISIFGPFRPLPRPSTDSPAVVNAVSDPETHRYGDFQTSASGNHAVFPSSRPLTGFDTAGHIEVYRFEASSNRIDCASCAPTGVQATGDAALARNGLSLSDDGRVFFNSTDELAPRDLNKKQDAYEWSDGRIELISTGSGSFDSGLLSISSDGTDAYFFTRQALVKQDDNGSLVRIYDARANGGFASLPDRVSCQASDECHGPGSEQADPPAIGTFRGTLGDVTPRPRCKKGKVRRKGKCVRKKSQKRHRKNHKGRTGSGGGGNR